MTKTSKHALSAVMHRQRRHAVTLPCTFRPLPHVEIGLLSIQDEFQHLPMSVIINNLLTEALRKYQVIG